jgi:AraC-like DNA-binding protein
MDYTRYMKGLYIIGKLTEFNDGETIAFFLTPEGQSLVRDTFMEHAKRATENDRKDGGSSDTAHDGEAAFERLNDLVQFKLKKVVEAVEVEVEEVRLTKVQELNQQRNKPHAAGTITEIAMKLGVSKSEVRKMKRDGTLDTALERVKINAV